MIQNVPQARTNKILQGAVLLTAAGIITKGLSAIYRVPYQNIVGDIGFYIYQQIYPFLAIVMVLSTTGFPVILSKLLNEYSDGSNFKNFRKILVVCFSFFALISLFSFTSLFLGADKLARWMGDPKLALLLKAAACSFLFFPFISMLRGVFQSCHEMLPVSLSQIVEQAIRVGAFLSITCFFVYKGFDLYETAAGAIFSSLIGYIGAFMLLLVYWKKRVPLLLSRSSKETAVSVKKILTKLLIYTVTFCLTSMLMIFMQLADSFQLYKLMVNSGADPEAAKIAKGIYDRGQPLLQVGTVAATSLALSLVPLISSFRHKAFQYIQQHVALSFKICLIVAIGATAGLISIIEQVDFMLFADTKGAGVLSVFSISILFSSVAITSAGILQGVNETVWPALSVLAGVAVKILLNECFIPFFHTYGAALATVCGYGVVCLLNLVVLNRKKYKLASFKVVWKMIGSAVVMFLSIKLYFFLFDFFISDETRMSASIQSLTAVVFGAVVYLFFIIQSTIFTGKEIESLPFKNKLVCLISAWKERKENG
ncbi:putative polysaccharide biosynthesis protein [Aeribacillus pallidus]|uniref:putative polysaccharide biosynthesis protein n=1 Tax=Aeribacillus pallidus TaxID=33936 RepID=UPI0013C3532C|nr:oligosaccharide flippase family protein [Aeribacillus pallidus]